MAAGYVLAAIMVLVAGWLAWWLPRQREVWRRLPRERYLGAVLGAICLVWAVQLVSFLLEGGLEPWRRLLWPTAIVLWVGSCFLLDYLFTRALGGLLLLLVNEALHQAFVAHAPVRPLFAVVCYVLGIAGMVMIASPFRFRDLLQQVERSPAWRRGLAAGCLAAGLVFLSISLAA
jgi:hypothetical protein